MSKKGTIAVHMTIAGGQGAHASGQGTTFGEEGLEKEAHKEKKKVWDRVALQMIEELLNWN